MAKTKTNKIKGKKPTIGFIGQGWIGKNYADDFENRGYKVIRYALEEPHIHNGDAVKECDIVFVAVPTPTTPQGFDSSILKSAIKKVGKGKTAVIKSTLLPGTTKEIQKENPDKTILHSPEFLTEATAAHDAANPKRNIVGIPVKSKKYLDKAKLVLSVLPRAPFELVCDSNEAELIKYAGNNWFYFKIIFMNLVYDLSNSLKADFDIVRSGLSADPRVGMSHLMPVHKSGTLGSDNFHLAGKKRKVQGGRGAGGHCFIKDYSAFAQMYKELLPHDKAGIAALEAIENKNINLLLSTQKDLDLLQGVYGKGIIKRKEGRRNKK